MIFNLLSNALKFTPARGSAEVRLLQESASLVLEVRDTGIGISEEDLKRLAHPFEQASNSYAASQAGTGLGLALVKSLAGLHGGSLALESKLGAGTRARVALPLAKAGARAELAQAA
jgi:signal transduction histidine kinase